jgi:hypothetical protein
MIQKKGGYVKKISIAAVAFILASNVALGQNMNQTGSAQISHSVSRGLVFNLTSDTSANRAALDSAMLNVPVFAVYAGAGWISGGRAGFLARVDKHLSVELSYGYDFRDFFSASDIYERYGFGLNWHANTPDNMIISLLTAYSVNPNQSARPSVFVSGNVGLISMKELDFGYSARFGFFVELERNFSGNALEVRSYGPNLDFTLNWSFF